MPDFNAKMHQNRFRLELCPRPCWGSLQRSPWPLAGFKGPTSKGREGEGRGEWEKEGRGEEGEGRESAAPSPFMLIPTLYVCMYTLEAHGEVAGLGIRQFASLFSFFFCFLCQGHRSHCASDLKQLGLKTRRSAQGSAFCGSERCAPKFWG